MLFLIFTLFWPLQPLFPGESGVDQLVEIIKVKFLWPCICLFVKSKLITQRMAFKLSLRVSLCMQVLSTPTREEIKCMNPNYTEFKFPQIKAHPWHKVSSRFLADHFFFLSPKTWHSAFIPLHLLCEQIFHKRTPPEAVDLVSRLLQYSPSLRCTAVSLLPVLLCWN